MSFLLEGINGPLNRMHRCPVDSDCMSSWRMRMLRLRGFAGRAGSQALLLLSYKPTGASCGARRLFPRASPVALASGSAAPN